MRKVSKGAAWILATAIGSVWAPVAWAQQPSPDPPPATSEATPDPELPVSLDRIRAKLAAQPRTAESKDGLRLSYYVDVYGVAPRLEFFAPDINLTMAPVQYGGMTHREFLDLVTPEEFRSPAADIPSAIAALIKWAAERRKSGSDQR
jgi:hypothetical protein